MILNKVPDYKMAFHHSQILPVSQRISHKGIKFVIISITF